MRQRIDHFQEIHSDSLNEDIDRINGEDDVHIANKPKTFTKKRKETQYDNGNHATREKSSRNPKPYRRVERGMNLSRAKEILDFEEAKSLILANPKCGLKALREKRHITLPYHLIGGNILKSCEFIAKMTVGKYRSKVGGVVISIGSVKLASLPRVIDDQNVFHLDALITQAVFRPVVGQNYEARVTHIAQDFFSALILEAISISAPVNSKLVEKLKGITLEVDDVVSIKHNCITIKRGICQLKGKFVRILRKGAVKTDVHDEGDFPKKKPKQNRKTFDESDEET